MKDTISQQRIQLLHPQVRSVFQKFIEDAENSLGIMLRVAQGLRTIAEQDALYAQGRTVPGNKVTNAKGGSSYHNYGLAVDLVKVDGKVVDWNYDMSKLLPYMPEGMVWGGNFKSIKDRPHFEYTLNNNWRTLLAKYKAGSIVDGYVNLVQPGRLGSLY